MCADVCADMCVDVPGPMQGHVYRRVYARAYRRWRLYVGSISASPAACPLRGHGSAGTRSDRVDDSFLAACGTCPMPWLYAHLRTDMCLRTSSSSLLSAASDADALQPESRQKYSMRRPIFRTRVSPERGQSPGTPCRASTTWQQIEMCLDMC